MLFQETRWGQCGVCGGVTCTWVLKQHRGEALCRESRAVRPSRVGLFTNGTDSPVMKPHLSCCSRVAPLHRRGALGRKETEVCLRKSQGRPQGHQSTITELDNWQETKGKCQGSSVARPQLGASPLTAWSFQPPRKPRLSRVLFKHFQNSRGRGVEVSTGETWVTFHRNAVPQ